MAEISLKHMTFEGDSIMYFYEGELPIRGGVVTIDSEHAHWAANAWLRGYRRDAATGEVLVAGEVQARLAEPQEVAQSDEKNGETVEGSSGGGQSPDPNGLRESEQPRRGGLLGRISRGRGGDRPADDGAGD